MELTIVLLATTPINKASVRQRFAANLAGSTMTVETLLGFVDVFRGCAEDPPVVGGCPILNTAIYNDDTNPALAWRAAAVIAEWRSLIRLTGAQGIARGEFRPETDGDALALLMIASLEGAVTAARLLRDAASLAHAANHLRRISSRRLGVVDAHPTTSARRG